MNEFKIKFNSIIFISDFTYVFSEKENKNEIFEYKVTEDLRLSFIPTKGVYLKKIIVQYEILNPKEFLIFRNGFQSWSPSYFFKNEIKERTPLISILKYHYLDPSNQYPNISYLFTCLKGNESFLMFYPKSYDFYNYFQIDKKFVNIVFEINKTLIKPLKFEIDIFETKNPIINKNFSKKIFGWTSWYYYYRNITGEEILKNLEYIKNIPIKLDYFQIDDGWQESIGDWFENHKFIDFFEKICEKLSDFQITPGIWLAPFIVEKKSSIFLNRKDLILKNSKNEIFPCGYNPLWSGYFYPLDITKEEVKDKIISVLLRLNKIGFKLFKLDFLYGGFIKSSDDSRYEKFINFFKDLKEILKDVSILGCGVPFILKDDLFDIARVGPDTMDGWKNKLLRFISFPGRVEAYNSLRNTLLRNILTPQKFLFDPDVIFLRPKNLNKFEKETIILTNYLLSNIIFFSDPIYNLKEEDFSLLLKLKEFKKIELLDVSFKKDLFIYDFKIDNSRYNFFVNLNDEKIVKENILLNPHESRLIKIWSWLSL